MTDGRLKDSEVFFVAAAGAVVVLLSGGILFETLGAADARSLLVLVAPIRPVRAVYAWFVLLPAALVFLGIGVPFALATVKRLARRDVTRAETLSLAALLAALCGIWTLPDRPWAAPSALLLMAASALAGAGRGGRALLEKWSGRLLAAAGACLLLLAAWEYRAANPADTKTLIVGPTFAVAVGALLPWAVLSSFLAGFIDGRRALWATGCLAAAVAWYLVPQLVWRLGPADLAAVVEPSLTAASGAWILVAGLRA